MNKPNIFGQRKTPMGKERHTISPFLVVLLGEKLNSSTVPCFSSPNYLCGLYLLFCYWVMAKLVSTSSKSLKLRATVLNLGCSLGLPEVFLNSQYLGHIPDSLHKDFWA